MTEKPQWRGEPAFPQYSLVAEGVFCEGGMTLRDYFAAKAMASALTFQQVHENLTPYEVAVTAYTQADAMLKARDGNA